MPKEENSVNGKMQLMLYKEMLDGMIVEGLRQHALEQKAQQQSEVEEDEDFQILDVKADDDVICLGSEEPQEGLRQSRANGCETDSDNRAAPQTQKTSHTVDRFTWRELFEHLSLDPAQPFTDGFLEQSRLLIEGNNLSVGVVGAETLQQMTSCWAEYVSKLGLGTIDPTQSEEQIEEALEKEIGGRRTGRSEKLLTLVYRRVGTTKKKKKKGDRRSQTETGGETGSGAQRGKRRKRGGNGNAPIENNLISAEIAVESDPPSWEQSTQVPADEMEVENERLLQLAIAESIDSTSVANGQHNPVQETIPSGATEMDLEEEPLPATLLPPEIFQATQQKLEQTQLDSQAVKVANNVEPKAAEPPTNTVVEKATEDSEGSIIGSQRFPYSSDLLSEHIDRILQFWTGIREPVGVSIENTTRCGWCEFEDGCEWR
jgi:exonuclease V